MWKLIFLLRQFFSFVPPKLSRSARIMKAKFRSTHYKNVKFSQTVKNICTAAKNRLKIHCTRDERQTTREGTFSPAGKAENLNRKELFLAPHIKKVPSAPTVVRNEKLSAALSSGAVENTARKISRVVKGTRFPQRSKIHACHVTIWRRFIGKELFVRPWAVKRPTIAWQLVNRRRFAGETHAY